MRVKYPRMPSSLFRSFCLFFIRCGFECNSVTMPVGRQDLIYIEPCFKKPKTECLNRHIVGHCTP